MNKPRILIVEDEAIIAMEIESQLLSLGYEVTSIVDTGEKAINKAEEDKPVLILMDIRIKSEMDGIEAAEEIRNRFGIPVIFSTAYLDQERIERAKITMPFGYVLKPIQERDLKVTIEMALYVAKVDSERKRVEDLLRIQRDLGVSLGKSMDFQEMLRLCMKAALEASNMDCGGIYIIDPASKSFCLAYHEGLSKDFIAAVSLFKSDSPQAQIVMTGNPAYANHDLLGVNLTRVEQNEDLKSMAIIPVKHTNQIVGCLNVASHALEEIPLFVRNTLETIVTQIGDAIIKKQVEARLKESEKQQRAWLENSPDCTKILDLDFNLQYMSSAGVRSLKVDDVTPFYGKPYPFEFYPDSFKIPMRKNLAKAKNTGVTITQEAPVVDVEGNEVWFHSTIVPINDDEDQLDYIMVVSVDTTERKHAELELKKLLKENGRE
ncbi:MAG: response regulator [Bacteroidetes bacterium]|jgi:PAS domain S-box-containing protein|nr:response regulator [Bacteroidota bacterium]